MFASDSPRMTPSAAKSAAGNRRRHRLIGRWRNDLAVHRQAIDAESTLGLTLQLALKTLQLPAGRLLSRGILLRLIGLRGGLFEFLDLLPRGNARHLDRRIFGLDCHALGIHTGGPAPDSHSHVELRSRLIRLGRLGQSALVKPAAFDLSDLLLRGRFRGGCLFRDNRLGQRATEVGRLRIDLIATHTGRLLSVERIQLLAVVEAVFLAQHLLLLTQLLLSLFQRAVQFRLERRRTARGFIQALDILFELFEVRLGAQPRVGIRSCRGFRWPCGSVRSCT